MMLADDSLYHHIRIPSFRISQVAERNTNFTIFASPNEISFTAAARDLVRLLSRVSLKRFIKI